MQGFICKKLLHRSVVREVERQIQSETNRLIYKNDFVLQAQREATTINASGKGAEVKYARDK